MRGSHGRWNSSSSRPGIIPAHAGLTTFYSPNFEQARDHPRACGAHQSLARGAAARRGSSPRMRGSHRAALFSSGNTGLTIRERAVSPRCRDHPRACGAHLKTSSRPACLQGSSPRMRGSRSIKRGDDEMLGIIPAHAGLTESNDYPVSEYGDHPRACGAHELCLDDICHRGGSSPRMRGSPDIRFKTHRFAGIIPAHAGLTVGCTARPCRRWDHPRACGAHNRE